MVKRRMSLFLAAVFLPFLFTNVFPALAQHPALRRISVGTPAGPVQIVAPPVMTTDGLRHIGPIPAIGEHSELIRAEFSA